MRWFWQQAKHHPQIVVSTEQQAGKLGFSRGRRQFVNLPYLLPKDLEEGNRLDFQHYLLKYVFHNANYLAPIRSPKAILDVGTGTGRWAREMARQFPDANVIALDITPPSIASVEAGDIPENYTFVQGNIFQGLPFGDNSFDFVHMRLLYAGLPQQQWPVVVQELQRVASHGGWIELVEGDIVINGGAATDRVQDWIIEADRRQGIDIRYGQNIGKLLIDAGVHNVRQQRFDLPLGSWGGRIGVMVEKNIIAVFKGIGAAVVKLGITDAQTYDLAMAAMQEALQTERATFPYIVAVGQKA